jgi:NAD(P)-dependent dehydrogenase (short-subunit alcohol dehydrogenase family)
VCSTAAVEALTKKVAEKFGALDILVNCAGDVHQRRQCARLFRARLGFLLRPQRQVDAPDHQGFPACHAAMEAGSIINIFSVA